MVAHIEGLLRHGWVAAIEGRDDREACVRLSSSLAAQAAASRFKTRLT
jgi:hypothetical protein